MPNPENQSAVADSFSPSIHPDRLYTPVQVAELLDLATQTLAAWRVQGRGPAYVKLSPKVVRYQGADLLQFLGAASTGYHKPAFLEGGAG